MISVSISINGNAIMARSARNVETLDDGRCRYRLDDGTEVVHDPDDGAVKLAKKMLDQIEEPGQDDTMKGRSNG